MTSAPVTLGVIKSIKLIVVGLSYVVILDLILIQMVGDESLQKEDNL